MLAPITHILPLTTIFRKRLLPGNGQVKVRIGDKLETTDVVAEAEFGHKLIILDIAARLHVSNRRTASLIKFKKGQTIQKGEVIAELKGFFGRVVKSPHDGRIVASGGGKLVLETGGFSLKLLAGIKGVVSDIVPDRGVIIRADAGLIQGVWGNGKIDTGVMMSVMDTADEVFDLTRMDFSVSNSIIFGGYVDHPKVFKQASENPVRGLILGSMSSGLIPVAMKAPFPVVVLEGFGHRPMGLVVFELLNSKIRNEVTLNGNAYDRINGDRPEVIFPEPDPVGKYLTAPQDAKNLESGQTIRVISLGCSVTQDGFPERTNVGTIIRVNSFPGFLPNGLRAKTADVQLESGEQISVPLTNLELLG